MAKTPDPNSNAVDYISSIPDDILLSILSKLDVKEQARTSTLSPRWRILWTFNSIGFNIDAVDFNPIPNLFPDERYYQMKTSKFINVADQILRMHRGQTLHELKITYPFGASETPNDHLKLNGWINFVKEKRVKALYLDFEQFRENPVPLLSLDSATFSSLVTLRLQYASLSSQIIQCLLNNSPNLLELSIISTNDFLHNLTISGSSIKLKHLKLVDNDIDFLEISAPNLVSFEFSNSSNRNDRGQRSPTIYFKNVPLLTQISSSFGLTSNTWGDYCVLLPQLDTLTLTLSHYSPEDVVIPRIPALENLKRLDVALRRITGPELCLFLGLFKASHALGKLSLDLGHLCRPLEYELTESFPDHKFLKELNIHNFSGFDSEVQLLTCIAQSCSSLKKIIIHPTPYKINDHRNVIYIIKEEHIKSAVDKLALRLHKKELQILFKA